jgi:hypothetical protein
VLCAGAGHAERDLIPLGDHVIDGEVEIGKRKTESLNTLFLALAVEREFGPRHVPGVIISHQLIDDIHIPFIPGFLNISAENGLVFCR